MRNDAESTAVRTLDQLRPGDAGIVQRLNGDGAVHQRLLEMGVIEGAGVEVVRLAPLGDPMELNVRGYELSVRKADAQMIEVQ